MHERAVFGPPVKEQVAGGLHIGASVITACRGRLLVLRRKKGLFGGPPNAWYFPTDYFRFAELISHCVRRLAHEQAGLGVRAFALVDAWSFVPGPYSDWHLGFCIVAEVTGKPRAGDGVEEIRTFTLRQLARQPLAWFTTRQLRRIFESPVVRRLKVV